MSDANIEALAAALKEDWWEVKWRPAKELLPGWEVADEIEGENRRWSRTNTVVMKSPDGLFYGWDYEEGLTENQDDEGPCEYGEPEIVRLMPVEVMTTEYVRF